MKKLPLRNYILERFYMLINNEIVLRINNIDWFSNCNKQFNITINSKYKKINKLSEVEKNINSINWENQSLDAQGELTEFLCLNYPNEYNTNWNLMVDEIKSIVLPNILNKVKLCSDYKMCEITDSIIADVKWNILGIIMAYSYKNYFKSIFYDDLLKIYEFGFLPCGWIGKYPQGKILIY